MGFHGLHHSSASSLAQEGRVHLRHAFSGVVFWAGNLPRHQPRRSRVVSETVTRTERGHAKPTATGQDSCPVSLPEQSIYPPALAFAPTFPLRLVQIAEAEQQQAKPRRRGGRLRRHAA